MKGKEEETSSSNHGTKDQSHVTCYKCHKKGHFANQCPEKRKGKGKQQQKQFARSTILQSKWMSWHPT
jgi:hypothetical protein